MTTKPGPKALAVANRIILRSFFFAIGTFAAVNISASTNTLDFVYTSPQHQKTVEKLKNIVIEKISPSNLPLSEVIRLLIEQTKMRDTNHEGVNFTLCSQLPRDASSSPGLLGAVNINLDPGLANIRLMDLLPIIVKSAEYPIKYEIVDYGVAFFYRDSNSARQSSEREVSSSSSGLNRANLQREKICEKLNDITSPMVSLPYLSLGEITNFLSEIVKKRDPSHEGVRFFLRENDSTNASSLKLREVRISLDPGLSHPRLIDVLNGIVNTADHPIQYRVRDDGVEFSFPELDASELVSRTFKIDLVELLNERDILPSREDFRADSFLTQWLNENGVYLFPPKSLSFQEQQNTLTVRATPDDLNAIDRLSDKCNRVSKLIRDGKSLFQAGKLDEAEAKLSEAMHIAGNNEALYYLNLITESRIRAKTEHGDATNSNAPAGWPNASLRTHMDSSSNRIHSEDYYDSPQFPAGPGGGGFRGGGFNR
jgi:hypothetical protein